MSTSFEELVDPRQEFLAQGWQPSASNTEKEHDPHILLIGMGIAAAIIGIKMIMSHRLAKENPQSPEEARGLAHAIWGVNKAVWRKLATPSIVDAYKYGATTLFIPPDQLEKLAVIYVDELGDYFNETSINALADGFSAQLNNGWAKDLAWKRSVPAYGLDAKQTRSYIVTLTEQPKGQYNVEAIPPQSAKAIDKAMVGRADRMGINEAYKAKQVGRNTVWMYMEKHGDLQQGAQKRWITARDELVCPTCAPLNGVTIPLDEQFVSNGSKFYAPGVHPNCRCEIVLDNSINIIKNLSGDPYDRDSSGRFSHVEMRTPKRLPIGTHVSPIGSVRAPIGSTSGPIGWARAPIGQSLPPIGVDRAPIGTNIAPIGAEIEPKIEYEPRPKPKIGVETTTKVKTKTKVKTPIKPKIKTPTKASTSIATPVASPVETKTKIVPKVVHKDPMIAPADQYIDGIGMNINRFIKFPRGAKNPVVYFGPGDIWAFERSEQGEVEAFSSYLSRIPAASEVRTAQSSPDLPFDQSSLVNPHRNSAFLDEKTFQGSASMDHKVPMVFFVLEDGWSGNRFEAVRDDDYPVIHGVPRGYYEIDIKGIQHRNADKRTNAYPEAVKDYIDNGINPRGFTDIAGASQLVSGIVYIPIRPVKNPDKANIIGT